MADLVPVFWMAFSEVTFEHGGFLIAILAMFVVAFEEDFIVMS